MLNHTQFQTAVAAAHQRFALIRGKYPELKAYLVLSSPIGQTKIESSPIQILSEFPDLIIDDENKAKLLPLVELMASKDSDDPEKKRLQKQADQLAGELELQFNENCQIEIRFHDLNYDLIWQLQADELVDRNLTPQTKASIQFVLGTLINFVGQQLWNPDQNCGDDEGGEDDEINVPELPLNQQHTPPLKIIDASVPKLQTSNPQLSDVWKERRDKKRERGASAPPTSLTASYKDYSLPPLELLALPDIKQHPPVDESALMVTQTSIIKILAFFGIHVTAGDITIGPAITRFEVYPSDGLRMSRIANLEADIARATKSERINMLAPIPGKDTVGIELPNLHKIVVPIRELLEDDAFENGKAKIPIALGKDIYGNAIIADLASMPHLLVAGATGSGKSVCINSIVTSLLCRFAPDEMRFIMIDSNAGKMQGYKDLPHLALPVVTDPKQSLLALRWVMNEMEERYQNFAVEGRRNIDAFNSRKSPGSNTTGSDVGYMPTPPPKQLDLEIPDSYPYIVVIVNELADLMQTAPVEIENVIARIAEKSRAAGIHLILATHTPRADVVTGIIKANIPCRIAFQVSSALESRVILDRKGADKLVGQGDMLYLPPGTSQLMRVQGTMVTDEEIQGLVEHCCENCKPL